MDNIDMINDFCKVVIITIYMYVICLKIINYKEKNFIKKITCIISCITMGIIYIVLLQFVDLITILAIIYCIFLVTLKIIIRKKLNYCLFLINISFSFTYIMYLISILGSGMLVITLTPKIENDSPIIIFIATCIMVIIYCSLIKIKRIKNGLNFIENIDQSNQIVIVVDSISLIILLVLSLLHNSKNLILNYSLAWTTLITLAGFIYWIQFQITKHYKKHMKDRTIEIQRAEIDEQVKLIEEIKEENLKLATTVHKYNNRLSAIELAMKEAISNNLNTEFANELSVILKETEELSKNFAKESNVVKNNLPLTNVPGVDNMFKYMQEEAIKNNINFDLKINGSINNLLENIIPKDKFETLLGDHLKDAIIAINSSNSSYKSILTTLGIVENCYELSIYDTGIEFEINTLLKLGKEQVTTHKDTGGSGIGFVTTFETLKTTKASLIIEEYNPKTTNYTKSVNIRFDGKGEYRIYSYRAEDIKNKSKEKRIIIKNIE